MNAEKHPIRILIVDDMPQVRRDLCTVLPLVGEKAGLPIQVVGEAGDGQEAIRLARILQPEVVLMDLAMPVVDGLAATQAIKAERPAVRVIALTIHGGQEMRMKAQQAGVDGFVEKGVPAVEILRVIGSCSHEEMI